MEHAVINIAYHRFQSISLLSLDGTLSWRNYLSVCVESWLYVCVWVFRLRVSVWKAVCMFVSGCPGLRVSAWKAVCMFVSGCPGLHVSAWKAVCMFVSGCPGLCVSAWKDACMFVSSCPGLRVSVS